MPAITGLNEAVAVNDADLLPVVQGGETKKLPASLMSRLNWLGTVSQAGGVPTGAIIESGSNANGEYVKFADGTMICTRVGSAGWNGEILRGTNYRWSSSWTFPAQFIDKPVVNVVDSAAISGLGVMCGFSYTSAVVNGLNADIFIYVDGQGAVFSGSAAFGAIGRWF